MIEVGGRRDQAQCLWDSEPKGILCKKSGPSRVKLRLAPNLQLGTLLKGGLTSTLWLGLEVQPPPLILPSSSGCARLLAFLTAAMGRPGWG